MRGRTLILLLGMVLVGVGIAFDKGALTLPAGWNPWGPLSVSDPPTPVTRWKLGRLQDDPEACREVLERSAEPALAYTPLADHEPVAGCPLENVVRLERAGVTFSSSFVATCPWTVAWLRYERHRLQPAARALFGEPVASVEHYGSFACRNVYGREDARRSQHATAEALDVAAYRLASGQRIALSGDWGDDDVEGEFLKRARQGACDLFGTVLGPDYNAAHADHFHLGMRGHRVCR
ncbi:extensin family protein [Halomonas denitrificans]|uniref:extensin-like domain-containing protein n=1 Tax=Halomonas denitrificans TaxID=370769 RepID=UPI000D35E671|nr:extensin family protein [Halomonas denitrificans]